MARYILTMLAIISTSACQAETREINESEAIELSNEFLAEHLPQVSLHRDSIRAQDEGDSWIISYTPPYDSTGGPIRIIVDKKTGNVVDSTMEQ